MGTFSRLHSIIKILKYVQNQTMHLLIYRIVNGILYSSEGYTKPYAVINPSGLRGNLQRILLLYIYDAHVMGLGGSNVTI